MRFFSVIFLLSFPLFAGAAEPVAECGAGKLYKIDDVPIVVVEGTWYEMGKQYGTLLKKEMKTLSTVMELGLMAFVGLERFRVFGEMAESQIQLYPKRFREIHRGMSEGSGLSLRSIAVLEHYLAADIAKGSGLFCSSVSVWGDFTTDGSLMMGRNFDFPGLYLQGCPFFCLTVFRPTDGSLSCATLGYVGEIGSVNLFNSQGLAAEVNVAVNMEAENGAIHPDRITATILLTTLGLDCDNITQCDAALKTYRFNFPLLCTVVDANEARTYEVGTRDVQVRQPDEPGLNTVTNWAYEGIVRDWEDERRGNLQFLANKYKGQIDQEKMKEILEMSLHQGGATIYGDANTFLTLHQLIFIPEKKSLSIRQPNYKKNPKWIDIDLNQFFSRE